MPYKLPAIDKERRKKTLPPDFIENEKRVFIRMRDIQSLSLHLSSVNPCSWGIWYIAFTSSSI